MIVRGIFPPPCINKEGYKMKNIEKVKIKTYEDFKEQLYKVKKSQSEIVLSYYKYCHIYDKDEDLDINFYQDLILDELKHYGLGPIKITNDLDLIFKFKNQAEAIIYIKPLGVEIFIYKL